jgi:hypothetical protein
MEFVLNLAWAMLTLALLIVWLRGERSYPGNWRKAMIALGMLAAILFPVISITDDLQIASSPAEIECSLRQSHKADSASAALQLVAALPPFLMTSPSFGFWGFVLPANGLSQAVDNPALSGIENRPPPVC